jgi:hypothetical protein
LLPSAAALIRQRKGRESVVRAAGKTFAEDSRYAWGNYIGQLATLECRNISHAIFYIAELIALTFEKGKIDPGAAGQFLPKKKQQEEYDSVVHRTIADPPADRETVTVRQGALAGEVLKRGAGGVRTSLWAVLSAAGRAEMKNYLPPELSVQTLMVREQGRGAAKEVLLRCSIRQALGLPPLEATGQEVKIEDLIAATDKYLTAMLQQCREEGLSVNIHELMRVDSVVGSKKFSAKVKALALVRDIAAAGSQSIAPTSSGTSAGRMLDEHLPGRVKSQGSIIGEAAKILFNVNEEVTAGTVPAYLEFILAANRILPLATFGENALFFWQVERALGQAEGSFVGQAMRLLIGHAPEKTLQEMIIDDLLTTLKLELQRERGVKEAYYRAIRE